MSDTTIKTLAGTNLEYNDTFPRCSTCGHLIPCEFHNTHISSENRRHCVSMDCHNCAANVDVNKLDICSCAIHPDDKGKNLKDFDLENSAYRNSQRLRGLLLESQQDYIEEVSALNVIIREKDDHIDTLIARDEERHKVMCELIDELNYEKQLHKEACIDRDNNKTRLRELRGEI